jgi:hypothetical protein
MKLSQRNSLSDVEEAGDGNDVWCIPAFVLCG